MNVVAPMWVATNVYDIKTLRERTPSAQGRIQFHKHHLIYVFATHAFIFTCTFSAFVVFRILSTRTHTHIIGRTDVTILRWSRLYDVLSHLMSLASYFRRR
jgi:hypothetical protein